MTGRLAGARRLADAILCVLVAALPVVAAAQTPPESCQQITAACQRAGFVQGGVGTGTGLLVDCIAPIIHGIAQPGRTSKPLPQIDPQLVTDCKTREPNFGRSNALSAPANADGLTRIMPLGDSITFGTPDPGYGGYRHALGALLRADGYKVEFVGSQRSGSGAMPDPSNEGHPGWTIAQIKRGIDANRWLEATEPDLILLHIGTNDIRLGLTPSAPGNLSALLDDILARLPRVRVLVAQIIPFRPGADKDHQSFNDTIPRIIASKGPRVSLIDMRNILSPGDYADEAHPNSGGYDKMAGVWEAAIRAIMTEGRALPQPTPIRESRRSLSPREPRGIYAAVLASDRHPYTAVIDNPAISGLFLYFDWAAFEPEKDQFDFGALEEALNVVEARHKTLQLAFLPGFWTPRWVLDELPSCDDWLASNGRTGPAPPRCGKATFGFPEGEARKGELHELPLPWNPLYKSYWHAFLAEAAKRFGQREALVSIAIAGPTSQSEEIIMPHNGPGETEKWARLLEASFRDPSYHRSNRAFVEEWKAAIDDYGRLFNNLTLALTRAAGLPFNPTGPGGQEESTSEIAAYFARRPLGQNAKATQNNGVTAAHALTMRPVKEMSADATINPRILGGGQFATGFSRAPAREGCASYDISPAACQSITPEQALDNVLSVFFAGTPYGHFFNAPDGTAPVQYLQIYLGDILYGNDHPSVQAKLLEANKRLLSSR